MRLSLRFPLALLALTALAPLVPACVGSDAPATEPVTDGGATDATPAVDAGGGVCVEDADCAKFASALTPAGCATLKCVDAADGGKVCLATAVDKDGDGFGTATCAIASTVGVELLGADDCDDSNKEFSPAQSLPCFGASAPYEEKGACRIGAITCADGKRSACEGAVVPATESCATAGIDDDCDGVADEGCPCTKGATQPCGTDVGTCTKGTQTCGDNGWGACSGVAATAETCDVTRDRNCDGTAGNAPSCMLRLADNACGVFPTSTFAGMVAVNACVNTRMTGYTVGGTCPVGSTAKAAGFSVYCAATAPAGWEAVYGVTSGSIFTKLGTKSCVAGGTTVKAPGGLPCWML